MDSVQKTSFRSFEYFFKNIFFIGFYQLVQLQYLKTGSGSGGSVSTGARTPASFAPACNQASSRHRRIGSLPVIQATWEARTEGWLEVEWLLPPADWIV